MARPAVREIIRFVWVNRDLEIRHDADLPARSGMGFGSVSEVAGTFGREQSGASSSVQAVAGSSCFLSHRTDRSRCAKRYVG
jgi:hypothetical protein